MTTSANIQPIFRARPRQPGTRQIDWNSQRIKDQVATADAAIGVPFVGLTTDGEVIPNLFSIKRTGISTKRIADAAEAFLASLNEGQRSRAVYAVDAPEWRKWANFPALAIRHGLMLEELPERQRNAAMELAAASLSSHGFELLRNCMKLNDVSGDITNDHATLSEWLYWITLFGTPSADEPWGWQLDGHHLIINCLILGDQMVLTPNFMGAEPNFADRGPYAGTTAFLEEERHGVELMQSLTPAQRSEAIIYPSMLSKDLPAELAGRGDGRHRGGAYRDNLVLPYEGVSAGGFSAGQREKLLQVVETYLGRMAPGHDKVRLDEVKQHLDATHLAWIGKYDNDSVFYYKIHSPVIWIEFDHHAGIFLDNEEPERFHVHTIVRTPNGNDYGKDLLRQHYEQHHKQPTA